MEINSNPVSLDLQSKEESEDKSISIDQNNSFCLPEFNSISEVTAEYSFFVGLFNQRPLELVPLFTVQLVGWLDLSYEDYKWVGIALNDACVRYEGCFVTQQLAIEFLDGKFQNNCMLNILNYQYVISNNKIWIHIIEVEKCPGWDKIVLPLNNKLLKMPLVTPTMNEIEDPNIRNLDKLMFNPNNKETIENLPNQDNTLTPISGSQNESVNVKMNNVKIESAGELELIDVKPVREFIIFDDDSNKSIIISDDEPI